MTDKVIERPIVEAQGVYDELTKARRALNKQANLRKESLDAIPKYKELSDEMGAARIQRTSVTSDFDEKEPSHKRRIDSSKESIDVLEAKLSGLALEHYKKTGTMLELKKTARDGSTKKVRVGFKAQMTLF